MAVAIATSVAPITVMASSNCGTGHHSSSSEHHSSSSEHHNSSSDHHSSTAYHHSDYHYDISHANHVSCYPCVSANDCQSYGDIMNYYQSLYANCNGGFSYAPCENYFSNTYCAEQVMMPDMGCYADYMICNSIQ